MIRSRHPAASSAAISRSARSFPPGPGGNIETVGLVSIVQNDGSSIDVWVKIWMQIGPSGEPFPNDFSTVPIFAFADRPARDHDRIRGAPGAEAMVGGSRATGGCQHGKDSRRLRSNRRRALYPRGLRKNQARAAKGDGPKRRGRRKRRRQNPRHYYTTGMRELPGKCRIQVNLNATRSRFSRLCVPRTKHKPRLPEDFRQKAGHRPSGAAGLDGQVKPGHAGGGQTEDSVSDDCAVLTYDASCPAKEESHPIRSTPFLLVLGGVPALVAAPLHPGTIAPPPFGPTA